MYAGSYSALTALQDFALRVPLEWFVRSLVLISMTLQLVLVVLGALRYLSSSSILRFIVWGAYISADAVAISALGTMMLSDRREIYGIWAPLLLMHLGGPDAITAYSMADNELWLRHGFNMVYQLSMAVYIIYASSLKGYPLAAAILLLIVGSIKYAERIRALRYGNYLRNVLSSLPISRYMDIKSVAEKWKYVVMGEDQVERMIEQEQASSSRKGLERSSRKGGEIVTIEDVNEAKISGRGYHLCVSHALFKMYKRRFGSSYFVKGDLKESRAFWVKLKGEEAFRLIEMELKFMYDAVFSKYSNAGFTKWGMLVRFLVTILLGAAGYLILGERESRQAQRMVTYIVISAAFVVEVFQIWRVIVSDWTRVHLICAYVVASKRREGNIIHRRGFCHIFERCRFQGIRITMVVVGKFQDLVGGNRYWSNQIPQHSLVDTWLHKSPIMCKMAGLFPKPDSFFGSCYIKLRHTHKEHVTDDLRLFIFEIIKEACNSEEYSAEECKQNIYNFEKNLFHAEPEIREILESHGNLEEVILMWHIATTLCDKLRELRLQNGNEKNVKLSRILSRYCAYLLLSRPNLLPLRSEMARIVYTQIVNQLMDRVTLGSILEKNPEYLLGYKDNDDLLGSAAKLADHLLSNTEKQWELLAQYWGKLVIYMAVYNKAIFHAECVADGGEFLSQVWVLLGHMGFGEDPPGKEKTHSGVQNESAATVERSTGQDPAATAESIQSDLQNESAATTEILSGSEIELASAN